jgi:4-amino-4-deoxy-L-arabinose transferase-like glycosyltransferase
MQESLPPAAAGRLAGPSPVVDAAVRATAQPLQRWLPLLLILVAAAALRLMYIEAPLLDAHRWRQVDTASIARFFYEDRFNPLMPEVNWGGAHGYVESEFPLLPAMAALVYMAFGPNEMWGRLIVALFSLGAVALTYVLAQKFLGRSGGLAAAALVAFSPAAVFYGRAFMPDTLMVFFSLAAIIGFVEYADRGQTRALVVGSIALGLAVLVKLPGVIVVAPVLGALWTGRRWDAVKDRRLLVALILPLLVAGAWYWHAYQIFRETGLTFGVIGTTKTYPAYLGVAVWRDAFSKWSSIHLLTSARFYTTLLTRLYFLDLTPVGFALSAIGVLAWRRLPWRLVPDGWLAAMVAFILAAGEGHMGHDYYQLPLVPIFALYFAAVARPAFDAEWMRRTIGQGIVPRVAMATVVGMYALIAFWQSGVIDRHFRPEAPDLRILLAGEAIGRAAHDGLMVVVDDYGVNSPMLLYFAHARGWSLDPDTVTPSVIQTLQARGARYFATTRWSEVQRRQPDLALFLETRRAPPLSGAPSDIALFDLAVAK